MVSGTCRAFTAHPACALKLRVLKEVRECWHVASASYLISTFSRVPCALAGCGGCRAVAAQHHSHVCDAEKVLPALGKHVHRAGIPPLAKQTFGVLHCTAPLDVRNPRTRIAQQRHHGHQSKRQATTCVVLILRFICPLYYYPSGHTPFRLYKGCLLYTSDAADE